MSDCKLFISHEDEKGVYHLISEMDFDICSEKDIFSTLFMVVKKFPEFKTQAVELSNSPLSFEYDGVENPLSKSEIYSSVFLNTEEFTSLIFVKISKEGKISYSFSFPEKLFSLDSNIKKSFNWEEYLDFAWESSQISRRRLKKKFKELSCLTEQELQDFIKYPYPELPYDRVSSSCELTEIIPLISSSLCSFESYLKGGYLFFSFSLEKHPFSDPFTFCYLNFKKVGSETNYELTFDFPEPTIESFVKWYNIAVNYCQNLEVLNGFRYLNTKLRDAGINGISNTADTCEVLPLDKGVLQAREGIKKHFTF